MNQFKEKVETLIGMCYNKFFVIRAANSGEITSTGQIILKNVFIYLIGQPMCRRANKFMTSLYI